MAEEKNIPNYWQHRIRGGRNAWKLAHPLLFKHQILSTGWSNLSFDEFVELGRMDAKYFNKTFKQTYPTLRNRRSLERFIKMKKGDYVVVPLVGKFCIYEIEDDNIYTVESLNKIIAIDCLKYGEDQPVHAGEKNLLHDADNKIIDLGFFRKVTRVTPPISRNECDKLLYNKMRAHQTNISLNGIKLFMQEIINHYTMGELSSTAYMHRVAQQVLITKDEEGFKYSGYGSGFFLEYQGYMFFVTAAHLLYSEDDPHELLTDYLQIVYDYETHVNDGSLVGKYYHVNNIYIVGDVDCVLLKMMKDMDDIGIKDYISCDDIAFSYIAPSHIQDVFTIRAAELQINNVVESPHGAYKIPIEQCSISDSLSVGDKCVVQGILLSQPIGQTLQLTFKHHYPIVYSKRDMLNDYIFTFQNVEQDDWTGLSGSPVFSEDYKLIGILLRVDSKENNIIVAPMTKLKSKLDFFIARMLSNHENNLEES